MGADCIVVIGGGIAGASVALHLAEAGAEVVLVDDDRDGRATRAGAGIVGWPWRDPRHPSFALRRHAVAAYPELAERIGADLEVVGELFVAPPGRRLAQAEAALADGSAGPVRALDPEQARALFPYLSPDLRALHIETTARVHGDAIRDRLLDAAAAAGARRLTGRAALERGPRGTPEVRLAGKAIPAAEVVIAAGAWSAPLAAAVGCSLAVAPQRGQILHLAVAGETGRMPVVQPLDAEHYLLPFAGGSVVVGATRESGAGFDPRPTAAGVAEVLGEALRVAPGLAGAAVRETRVGLRPATPDGDPILGRVPGCQRLWAATGMGPVGLTIGPHCGRLVAEAILGRPTEIDLAPFSSARF